MSQEPLQPVSPEKWPEIQQVFLTDWPRSIPGYNLLERQAWWKEKGFDCQQVYCPFGDPRNGFVAVNEKENSYEVSIHYPKDDTKTLEDALRTTKIIKWDVRIVLPFTGYHVISCIKNIIEEKDVKLNLLPSDTFILDKDSPLFEDVSLPPGFTFDLLLPEHVDLVDSNWPHRYPGSDTYFKLLIDGKCGYGLYKDKELVSWIFAGECGNLTHLCTVPEHRRKGYAELVLKLVSNEILKENRIVEAFCVKGNTNACELYHKIGFRKCVDVTWGFVLRKDMPNWI